MCSNNSKLSVKVQDTCYKPVLVRATKQGNNFCEVVSVQRPTKQGVRKISKTQYMIIATWEIKDFKNNELRQNESLKKTFIKLIGLIRENFNEYTENQLFITLTYAENMTNEKQLYKDFKAFYGRLKYQYKQYKFEYISVAEPQERGAWHIHVMLKATNLEKMYIDNKSMGEIWGHGMTKTERLKSDDVGLYYVSRFTDILNTSEDTKSKKSVKGSRLRYYPKGFNFYRCSRGIKRPISEVIRLEEIEKEYGKAIYEKSFAISEINENEEKIVNKIYKATFKKKQSPKRKNTI